MAYNTDLGPNVHLTYKRSKHFVAYQPATVYIRRRTSRFTASPLHQIVNMARTALAVVLVALIAASMAADVAAGEQLSALGFHASMSVACNAASA